MCGVIEGLGGLGSLKSRTPAQRGVRIADCFSAQASNAVVSVACELRHFPIITTDTQLYGKPPSSRPVTVFMSCSTKNAKVINIALSSLQRLIALCTVPLSVILAIIQTINDRMSQGVDIQLKILQIPLPHHQLCHHSRQTTRKRMYFRSEVPLLFCYG